MKKRGPHRTPFKFSFKGKDYDATVISYKFDHRTVYVVWFIDNAIHNNPGELLTFVNDCTTKEGKIEFQLSDRQLKDRKETESLRERIAEIVCELEVA